MGKFRVTCIGQRVKMGVDDESYLLWLRFEDPFRRKIDYVRRMWEDRGVMMSESTISRWFNHRFERRSRFVKADMVPVDKYRPGNILAYSQFCSFVQQLDSRRLVFTDEKLFKAEEGILTVGRKDPLTGEVPKQVVNSDFRNRYCVMGMISINTIKGKSVVYTIGKITLNIHTDITIFTYLSYF